MASASKAVSTASRYDEEMKETDEELRTVLYSLEDIEGKLDTYISAADFQMKNYQNCNQEATY